MAEVKNIIPGKLVGLFISLDTVTAAWKEVVCGQDIGLQGTKETEVVFTKCGSVKGTSPVSWVITGSGLAVSSVNAASELSANDLTSVMQGDDDILVKLAHIEDSTLYFRRGIGHMTAYNERAGVNDNIVFDFTIEINGELDIEEFVSEYSDEYSDEYL